MKQKKLKKQIQLKRTLVIATLLLLAHSSLAQYGPAEVDVRWEIVDLGNQVPQPCPSSEFILRLTSRLYHRNSNHIKY